MKLLALAAMVAIAGGTIWFVRARPDQFRGLVTSAAAKVAPPVHMLKLQPGATFTVRVAIPIDTDNCQIGDPICLQVVANNSDHFAAGTTTDKSTLLALGGGNFYGQVVHVADRPTGKVILFEISQMQVGRDFKPTSAVILAEGSTEEAPKSSGDGAAYAPLLAFAASAGTSGGVAAALVAAATALGITLDDTLVALADSTSYTTESLETNQVLTVQLRSKVEVPI